MPTRPHKPSRDSRSFLEASLLASLALLLFAGPGQAECVQGGKTAYKLQSGKWIPARVCIESSRLEIFNRKDESLVARFSLGERVEVGVMKRFRSREGAKLAAGLAAVFTPIGLAAYWSHCREQSAGTVDPSDCTASAYGEIALGLAVTGAAIGGIVAFTKSKHPVVTVGEGLKTAVFRVRNRDREWLRKALAGQT